MGQTALATKVPTELKEQLDQVCKQLGLRMNFIVEQALREKLEDILDAADLEEASKEATGLHTWESIKTEIKRKKK